MKVVVHAWRDLANPDAGGSERHVDQLATSLVERGHDVTLVAGGPVGPRRYPVVSSGSTYGQYLRVPFVDRRVAADADLVVDVANGMTYCSPLWHRGATMLVLHHLHLDQWATRFPGPVAAGGRFFESTLLPRIYRERLVVVCSPSTALAVPSVGFDPDLVRVVVPGIDATPTDATEAPEPTFAVLGRLMAYKRVDLVLDAWRRVRPHVGGTLHVVGDGPERTALEARGDEGVVFHGFVDEAAKREILARSWLLVHGAMHEGWGIAITEAGACGTPTLGFDVAGVRDAVRHGASGILVDDVDRFVAEWLDLAQDPERRRLLGGEAARDAERWSTSASGDAFEAAVVEAVHRHRAVRG